MSPASNQVPKSFAEFEASRKELFSTSFHSSASHPIAVGIERCDFEAARWRKLITVAETIPGRTIPKRVDSWRRKLERIEANKERFQRLRADSLLLQADRGGNRSA